MKRSFIIFTAIVVIAVTVICLTSKDKVADKLETTESTSNQEELVEMLDLYHYLENDSERLDADYRYVNSTDSIEVTARNSRGDFLNNVRVGKFQGTNMFYLEDSVGDKYVIHKDLNTYMAESKDKGFSYIYLALALDIRSYLNSVLGEEGSK